MTSCDKPAEGVGAPTHYCVNCAARWVHRPDGTWSLTSPDCGPCCDNVAMGKAPIMALLADGSIDGREHDRVRAAYRAERRRADVARFGGIKCALCGEQFERHADNRHCPRRVEPRFQFPSQGHVQELLSRVIELVRACGGAGDDHDTAVWNEAVAEVEKELTRAWPRISGEST